MKKLNAYFKQNSKYFIYPAKDGADHSVWVSFIVQKDGRLTNISIKRGIVSYLDAEAIRLITSSAPWVPGEQSGYKIKQQLLVPIPFASETQPGEIHIDEPVDGGSNLSAVEHDTNEIFTAVEKSATFPGGVDAFQKYIEKNSKYPIVTDKVQAATARRVFLGFVIEKDGTLTDIKIFRGVNADLDAEAIRLLKASAPWLPGEQNGFKVRQQYVVPIDFLQN